MGNSLGVYLKGRRATVPPDERVSAADDRRVPGLRAEEVARLAGISPSYYRRLEQGGVAAPSRQVLARLADALQLDASGADYLARLAGLQRFSEPALVEPGQLSSWLARVLAQWDHVPAVVQTRNFDVVLANPLFERLTAGHAVPGTNCAELAFALEGAREMPDWETTAKQIVGALRYYGDPADARFREVTGGLLVRDRDFRRMWARYEARPYDVGRTWHMPAGSAGFFLDFRNLVIPGSGGHVLTAFMAEPGTSEEAELMRLRETDAG